MIKSRIVIAGALLAAAGAASAGSFSVTPTIATDYDWRGISQTDPEQDGDPAFQIGGTYSFDNGFYLGAWGSNVDFGLDKPDFEVDVYGGYAWGDSAEAVGYDVGVNYYSYPGESDFNFVEAYFGVAKGWFAGKVWYSPEFAGDGNDSAFYVEGNVTYPLVNNFSLLGHVGYSFGSYWDDGGEYLDYSAGVGYSYSNFNFAVKYVDNDIDGVKRSAVIASVSTTLPWGE
jgi:uncharacterized protein (TIGR02001 family)